MRSLPNILITGTPGVGKSETAKLLADRTNITWLDISQFAIEHNCIESYDENLSTSILNEDKLLDKLESLMEKGGQIVEYHGAELFPERWFDIVFVLRTDNSVLYDRLIARGYTGKKLENNIDCEIFQVILDEAKESYPKEIVHDLQNNTKEQMVENVHRMCQWIEQWKVNNL